MQKWFFDARCLRLKRRANSAIFRKNVRQHEAVPMTSSPTTTIRVALIEDDAEFRNELAGIIERSRDCICVCQSGSMTDAVRDIPASHPDVVIVDFQLPDGDGIECIYRLREKMAAANGVESAAYLVLTSFADTELLFRALRAGADGYLVKRATSAKILEGIRVVNAGGSLFNPDLATRLADVFRDPPGAKPPEKLTKTESEVAQALAQNLPLSEIASQMGCRANTIRTHRNNIFKKLGVHSWFELAIRLGIPPRHPPKKG